VVAVIDRQGAVADKAMHRRWKEAGEFKKYLWERGCEMDVGELAENRRSANLEMRKIESKHRFLAKLSKTRKSPFLRCLLTREFCRRDEWRRPADSNSSEDSQGFYSFVIFFWSPRIISMENENRYVISWQAKFRASCGQGKRRFTREAGARLAEELNRDYPNFVHEAVEVLSDTESQAQLRADDGRIIRDIDFNVSPEERHLLSVPFNEAA
jgi:hypothetical protein